MNIFEVHRQTTSRIEPLHTYYLAHCLKERPELLERFCSLITSNNPDWHMPSAIVNIVKEDTLDDGKRVDLVLINSLSHCLIAVEAKTTDSSVELGQLSKYLVRLETKYPSYRIWMAYLTPFNVKNKPEGSRGQKAINEFQEFNKAHSYCSHLSWEEVANLANGVDDEVWRQHREYVKETICKPPPLVVGWGKLDDDLGWEILRDFWQIIGNNGFESVDGVITLKLDNDPWALVNTIKLLLSSEKIRSSANCPRTVADGVKSTLISSPYGQFHQQIFQLLNEYPFLGIRGTGGYGLTIPVRGVHRIVSICTVHIGQPGRLAIGRPPLPFEGGCTTGGILCRRVGRVVSGSSNGKPFFTGTCKSGSRGFGRIIVRRRCRCRSDCRLRKL